MHTAKWTVAAAALAALAGCASTADSTAQGQCQYFARSEGLEFVRVVNATTSGDTTRVDMQVKDALGRPFNATCVSGGGKAAWAQPLPANTVRRGESETIGSAAKPSTGAPPAR
jgi:hypothetical protein